MSRAPRIVVIGATGFTGSLVAHELAERAVPFVLAGRSEAKLARLGTEVGGADTRVVDARSHASVASLLRRGDVVINCAGPFTDLGEPVVEGCVRAGAHYLDTTGEQRFMKRVLERYTRGAREAGVVVANAIAFEYALGDCAAAVAAQGVPRPLRSVELVYAWHGGATGSSRGTRRSVLRVIREGGYAFENGTWELRRTGATGRTVQLPGGKSRSAVWFPAGEILTVPRNVPVEAVRAWMVTSRRTAALVPLAASVLPTLVQLTGPLAELVLRRAPDGPTEEARRKSRFTILAEATGVDGSMRATSAQGSDPYGLTAKIVVHGATKLLEGAESSGVLTPFQLLGPEFRTVSEEWGITWRRHPEVAD